MVSADFFLPGVVVVIVVEKWREFNRKAIFQQQNKTNLH